MSSILNPGSLMAQWSRVLRDMKCSVYDAQVLDLNLSLGLNHKVLGPSNSVYKSHLINIDGEKMKSQGFIKI